jgi:hypothetical protein
MGFMCCQSKHNQISILQKKQAKKKGSLFREAKWVRTKPYTYQEIGQQGGGGKNIESNANTQQLVIVLECKTELIVTRGEREFSEERERELILIHIDNAVC